MDPQRMFLFYLARELGMTVSELTAKLSVREFMEWTVFYKVEGNQGERRTRLERQLR
jgi:hypothetical protein